MENEKSLEKRFRVCSPSSINRTVREQESQTDEKQRREEKELDAFRNFWSGINDIHEDDNIDNEDDLEINIADLVEQEVNKRRKQERDKEEMRLCNC